MEIFHRLGRTPLEKVSQRQAVTAIKPESTPTGTARVLCLAVKTLDVGPYSPFENWGQVNKQPQSESKTK